MSLVFSKEPRLVLIILAGAAKLTLKLISNNKDH